MAGYRIRWHRARDSLECHYRFPASVTNVIPLDLTRGPDGNHWFTEIRERAVGRIAPAGAITLFPIADPSHISSGDDSTAGPDGTIWFTYSEGIRRTAPAGAITEFALPAPRSTPIGIVVGSAGKLWFTEQDGNQIGALTL